jgi:hypothetical protein
LQLYYQVKLSQLCAALASEQQHEQQSSEDSGSEDMEDLDYATPKAALQDNQRQGEEPSSRMYFMGLGSTADSPGLRHRVAGKDNAAKLALMERLGPQWGEALQEVSHALGCLGLEAASEEAYTLVLHW